MDNWENIKEKYLAAYQTFLAQGFSKAAADELAIVEARN